MSIETFIPEVWSGRLIGFLDKNHVFGNLVNRDYEGEIRQFGDTVHINQIGNVTIKKYTKNSDIDAPEDLNTTEQLLIIDQAEYFNFGLDDIDKAQARTPLMDKAMARTSYALSDVVDKFIADTMVKGAKIKVGSASSPINITEATAYNELVKLKVAMDKANVPKQGRWVVVPPDFEGMMLLDPRFASADGTNAEGRLVNGLVARACGFDIYISNNVPETGGKFSVIASNSTTTTFAEQIVNVEAYRPEKSFKDAMKGLNVYGAKVTQGDAVALMTVTFTASAGA